MANILSPQTQSTPSQPRKIPATPDLHIPPSSSRTLPPQLKGARNNHLSLETFSPVNQNGSFEFDRVLKSGEVNKRTRKTKSWKPIHLVLRPNLLSIYKNERESKLRHKIPLAELTAVAHLKDPKKKRDFVFGLFSPSRNYHLQAKSKADAKEWVELIRREARIEQEEEQMFLASPGGHEGVHQASGSRMFSEGDTYRGRDLRLESSSPEPMDQTPGFTIASRGKKDSNIQRQFSQTLEYSGNELGSHSDFSDGPTHYALKGASTLSLSQQDGAEGINNPYAQAASRDNLSRPVTGRNASQLSGFDVGSDSERVVRQGRLHCLNSKGGVRQWRNLWVVLRSKHLALYKNQNEYAPSLIIPLSTVVNAVEIDPISKRKPFCMQVIGEAKSYRFCAADEDSLAKWLGAMKSILSKRKEAGEGIAAGALT
ncbi:MAG: hypothetical protein M1812_004088 [Candelaria pacifica]|nr:MAG: hypothetical protein M1812_004088 [Candelaria pacifica]